MTLESQKDIKEFECDRRFSVSIVTASKKIKQNSLTDTILVHWICRCSYHFCFNLQLEFVEQEA